MRQNLPAARGGEPPKAGGAPGGAGPYVIGAGGLARPPRAYVTGPLRGPVAQDPWRLPALHPAFAERKKGKGGTRAFQTTGLRSVG